MVRRLLASLCFLLVLVVSVPSIEPSAAIDATQPGSAQAARGDPAAPRTSFDCATVTQVSPAECVALVALYNSAGGPGWTGATGWLASNEPCGWTGVSCDLSGHITELELRAHNLIGSIPAELGDLAALQVLVLGANRLTGAIPPELGKLTALRSLWLEDNALSGSIPPELGNLTVLEDLFLLGNQLTGNIPSELGRLVNLKELNASGNKLTGRVPPELGDLSKLVMLYLNDSLLEGPLPLHLMHLTNLDYFGYSATGLCAPAAVAFQNWLSGISEELDGTGITCPEHGQAISGRVSLGGHGRAGVGLALSSGDQTATAADGSYTFAALDAGTYTLTPTLVGYAFAPPTATLEIPPDGMQVFTATFDCGQATGVPQAECEALVSLYDSTNGAGWPDHAGWADTVTPCAWKGVTCDAGHVARLSLSGNGLTGAIPTGLGRMAGLTALDVSHNQLAGALPQDLTQLRLARLDFSSTALCAPGNTAFQAWLGTIASLTANGSTCPLTIRGRVIAAGGACLAGVTVGAGPDKSVATDANGDYAFIGLLPATYTLVPARAGYAFQPASRTITVPPDTADVDFSGSARVASVGLDGPMSSLVGAHQAFTATAGPLTATLPITYTWAATGLPDVRHASRQEVTDTMVFWWPSPGTKAVTVTASNGAGLASDSVWVTIYGPVSATFGAVPVLGPLPLTVHFTNDSSGGFTASVWDFGDGEASHVRDPDHVFVAAGTYTVSLTVSGPGGVDRATRPNAVVVHAGSQAAITPETGGRLAYTDTTGSPLEVVVPAGAVTQAVDLVCEAISEVTAPAGFGLAGHAFALEPYRDGTRLTTLRFEAPISITLHYASADVQGLDEAALTLGYWDGSTWVDAAGTCEPPSTYERHPEANWLVVPICHLSRFALLGPRRWVVYLPLAGRARR